jgi:HEPN domain-containing protein
MSFTKDPAHWLFRLAPDEWIAAATGELSRAKAAYARNDVRAGVASVKRAAGMALNGALILEPNAAWGRSYVEHLQGAAADPSVPEQVRAGCKLLVDLRMPASDLLGLRSKAGDERALEAARDVIAHAYWVTTRTRVPSKGDT